VIDTTTPELDLIAWGESTWTYSRFITNWYQHKETA
jgi:hypothetical protein